MCVCVCERPVIIMPITKGARLGGILTMPCISTISFEAKRMRGDGARKKGRVAHSVIRFIDNDDDVDSRYLILPSPTSPCPNPQPPTERLRAASNVDNSTSASGYTKRNEGSSSSARKEPSAYFCVLLSKRPRLSIGRSKGHKGKTAVGASST